MDFNLTKEQLELRAIIRAFAQKEIAPYAAELDRKAKFPAEILKKLAALGYFGMCISKEFIGLELDAVSQCIVIEEVSKACASTACCLAAHASIGTFALRNYGTAAQKQKYLPILASGEMLACFSLTETNAGSDAANIQTISVKDQKENNYTINGHKIFATNGRYADMITLATTINPELKHKGVTLFLIEKDMQGLKIGKSADKLGLRATDNCELFFENAKVSAENRIGDEGEGFKILMEALDESRILIAAQAVGIAQQALELSIEHCKNRMQFGKQISDFQATQFKLADMATGLEAARILMYKAAALKDELADKKDDKEKNADKSFTKEAAQAKLFASEIASKITIEAIQLHGGKGYLRDYPVERLMRDAKVTEIYEGTSEIQRLVIAREMLKEDNNSNNNNNNNNNNNK
ncbi:acyl-CoA dehydrogenase family protein [Candidatus Woesearchaeota archaeon]|nr:acyl-CoA dehydrogenase family protein [Candidatus Woesearchaeota archaeon]